MLHYVFGMGELPKLDDGQRSKHAAKVPDGGNPSTRGSPRSYIGLSPTVSRNPSEAWTTRQWMTERPGGSDVSNIETLATYMPEDRQQQQAWKAPS